ncbi:trehalase-like [Paramacrobiotus metropolitanus]|uniref:trehalase-like n=1 Tax=Paramacrobiotus metropolitanus TaxID=2943436 RepID=UPI002445AF1B|nr:trehalase-like [Paramacrobiotus metropolitanus]
MPAPGSSLRRWAFLPFNTALFNAGQRRIIILLMPLLLRLTAAVEQLTEADSQPDDAGLPCSNPVYCYGEILDTVQGMRLHSDSKTYVDLPLRHPVNVTLAAWQNLTQGNLSAVTPGMVFSYLAANYDPLDNDIAVHPPLDYRRFGQGGVPFAEKIADRKLFEMALRIHNKWRDLGRNISLHARDFPEQHTLIWVPHAFIVPGGRFDEIYYWDSYWLMQGLLASNMPHTVQGMLRNFAYLIHKFGHCPNGNRIYYLKRSQPPFLALMLDLYRLHYNVPNQTDTLLLIKEMLPALQKEHDFWMNKRRIEVSHNGKTYLLNVYRGDIKHPRPESYLEDRETGERYKEAYNQTDAAFLFTNIAAAAESGWDFSTRWLERREAPFHTIRTETIVPVDLNAVLCAVEQRLAIFYELTGDPDTAEQFRQRALDRGDALEALFWNETRGVWLDYDSRLGRQREEFYLSGVQPIFHKCSGRTVDVTSTARMRQVLNSFDLRNITRYPGGFPTSSYFSATNCCQWDFPNAWAPLQLMLIEGFAHNPEMRSQALAWAQIWVKALYDGHAGHGHFYEKYDVREPGEFGFGGEYVVQEGFGWTNGGLLRLLEMFPTELRVRPANASLRALSGEAAAQTSRASLDSRASPCIWTWMRRMGVQCVLPALVVYGLAAELLSGVYSPSGWRLLRCF